MGLLLAFTMSEIPQALIYEKNNGHCGLLFILKEVLRYMLHGCMCATHGSGWVIGISYCSILFGRCDSYLGVCGVVDVFDTDYTE